MKTLTGTRALIRHILRRDRFLLPLWILIMASLPGTYAAAFKGLISDDPAALANFAKTISANPAMTSFYGPIFGESLGALAVWRANIVPVIVGLIGILVVIRHTRVEEETGRSELIGAAVVGRFAPLAAALITAFSGMLLCGLLIGFFLSASGAPGTGAYVYGLSVAVFGCAFAAIGGVAAQLSENARTARSIAGAVLGGAYLIRVADIPWATPLGWQMETRAYAGDRWWPMAMLLVLALVGSGLAVWLQSRRDFGAGLVRPGAGREHASATLGSPLGLAWRLQRGSLIGWSIGVAVLGVVVGGAAETAGGFLDDSPALREFFESLGGSGGVSDTFIGVSFAFGAIIVSGYAIAAALRARSEEVAVRAEPLLATAVSRARWAWSHLMFAFLGPVVLMVVMGLAAGLSYKPEQAGRIAVAALAPVPAVWVLVGIALALFGLAPRFTGVAWGALGAFFFLGQLGELLQLPQAAMDLSPFTHVSATPGSAWPVLPMAILTAVVIALSAAGLAGLRRRDIG